MQIKQINKRKKKSSSRMGNANKKQRPGSPKKGPLIWNKLIHKGPRFPSPYRRSKAIFKYNQRTFPLEKDTEEIAVMYAKHLMGRGQKMDNILKKKFEQNFFEDWRQVMRPDERQRIINFAHCDFSGYIQELEAEAVKKKNMPREEKKRLQERKAEELQVYRQIIINGRPEVADRATVEPPGLFYGHGDNPNLGKIKKRIQPEDVIINCSRDCVVHPPEGHQWKNVVHDQSVTWIACWDDDLLKKKKYISLSSLSEVNCQKTKEKYDFATNLSLEINNVRERYTRDLGSPDEETCQKATAVYLIDCFAIRVGNDKGPGQTQTTGCCSLVKENVQLLPNSDTIVLDFLGKDSIPYLREMSVSKRVYANLKTFTSNKDDDDYVFDLITTTDLNEYLGQMMNGLTAKVFRTYNATKCFKENLDKFSAKLGENDDLKMKILACKKANLEVPKLLNHQNLTKPKGKTNAMIKLETKIKDGLRNKNLSVSRLAILKGDLELKTELQTYSLGTSKANYIDPRVTDEWCNKYDVPLKKIYSKKNMEQFRWAFNPDDDDSSDSDSDSDD